MSSSKMGGIRDTILSLKSPAVFHGMISEWDLLKWGEEEWCNLFGEQPVPFRCGLKKCSRNPQWERLCKTEFTTMRNFFKNAQIVGADTWQYFDYKYLSEWLKETDAFKTLSWAKLGFPELTKDECTLWIGSSGAHTPCHMDSYGCNLVAQVYGHKQWILFSPSESDKLAMTRVPYEESSVYSALNFSAPIENINGSLDEVYLVTLSPGDVLFVPNHWWHYVENLDTAVAINTWIPLPADDDSRLDEALVRFLISQVTSNASPMQWSKMINPNEDSLKTEELNSVLNLIKVCLGKVQETSKVLKDSKQDLVKLEDILELPETKKYENESACVRSKKRKLMDYQDLSNCSASGSMVKEDLMDFKMLPKITLSDLEDILNAKCKCGSMEEHTQKMNIQDTDSIMEMLPDVVNAFCHPYVLKTVKSVLKQQRNTSIW